MSVSLQTTSGQEHFGVSSTQFEEIVANRNERSPASLKNMDNGYDSDEFSDKDERDKGGKSPSMSNYSVDKQETKRSPSNYSRQSSYDDEFEESDSESQRKSRERATSRKSTPPKGRHSIRSPEALSRKPPSILSPRSSKKSKIKKYHGKVYESPRGSSPVSSRQAEKSWGKPKNRSANYKVSRLDQTVVDRVLSANRHKVSKLESRLSHLVKELTMEREENKTLRQIHYRQEKELMKVTNEEAELPRLIMKHTTEVKSLRERLRRLQETANQKENRVNEQDKEILKLKDRCKYYKDLCEMKNLTERADLQKKLDQTKSHLEKSDSEISKLQRMLNLNEKAHSRHLKEHKDKLRASQAKLKEMEENYADLYDKLKEKERQLDYTNIYQRQIVLKEKNQVSLDGPPKMAALPAPRRPKAKKASNSSHDGNNNIIKNGNATMKPTVLERKEAAVNKKTDSVFLTAHSDTGSDKEPEKKHHIAEKDGEQLSITDGKELSDAVVSELNKEKSWSEDETAKEEEKRKREEFEKSLLKEEERLKKEKEEMERKKKEEEEREERKRLEREAKWREESARKEREDEERRKESATRAEEERRIESERRAKEEDEREKAEDSKKQMSAKEDSFFEDEASRKKKDLLLARLKAMDNDKPVGDDSYSSDNKRLSSGKSGDESIKSYGSKKNSHETRQADKNLHNGLPAVPKESSIISPPESVKSDPDSIVGVPRHKPVLLGRGNLARKSNNFSWLDDNKKHAPNPNRVKRNDDFGFGDYSPSMSDTKKTNGDLNGDIFNTGLSRRPARGRRREGGLEDNRGPNESGLNFGERRGSGGFNKPKTGNNLSFLSDDFGSGEKKGDFLSISPSNNEPLLPRRRRAQEKSGPAISSVFDNLDDDIEELAL